MVEESEVEFLFFRFIHSSKRRLAPRTASSVHATHTSAMRVSAPMLLRIVAREARHRLAGSAGSASTSAAGGWPHATGHHCLSSSAGGVRPGPASDQGDRALVEELNKVRGGGEERAGACREREKEKKTCRCQLALSHFFIFSPPSQDLADLLGPADATPADPPSTSATDAPSPSPLTHIDPRTGRAAMVDVSGKALTKRTATASALVTLSRAAFEALAADALAKGDALGVARIAGICAAKKTPDLIPLCHSIALAQVRVEARLDTEAGAVLLTATATTPPATTGVEMEALTAVSVAALALHDMTKALSPGTVIGPVRLEGKSGGKGGAWRRRGGGVDEWERGG